MKMQPATGSINFWRIGAITGSIVFLLWLAYFLVAPPRIPTGDLICFKDAGINFAKGEGLVSRLDPANPTLEPRVYSNYPPLFPILYGWFVRTFGISLKADEIFDLLGTAAAALLFWYFITPKRTNARIARLCVAMLGLILLMMPIGPFWSQRERPDALGFILILVSVVLLQGKRLKRALFWAGAVGGVNCCLSPYAFVLNCIALVLFGVCRVDSESNAARFSPRSIIHYLLIAMAGGVLPIAAVLLAGYLTDPEATERFFSNATGHATAGHAGIGYFSALLGGDFAHFLSAFSRYNSIRYKAMLAHLVVVLFSSAVFVFWHFRQLSRGVKRWVLVGILGISLVPICVFPYQPCYMSFTAIVVVALLVRLAVDESWQVARFQAFALFSLAFIALPACAHLFRESVLVWKAAPGYQRMDNIIASLEPNESASPPLVASMPVTYFSFKSRRFQVVDLAYLTRAQDAAQIRYFAIPGGIDGDAVRGIPYFGWHELNLEEVHGPSADYSSPLLNSRFLYSWECAIYRQSEPSSSR